MCYVTRFHYEKYMADKELNRLQNTEPLACKEFGSMISSYNSILTLQKKSVRKERLFVLPWSYCLLYSLFTVGGYDRAICYSKGHFSLLTRRRMEGEKRNGRQRKRVSVPTK